MEVLWLWLERISAICGILGITVLGLAKLLGAQSGRKQIPEQNTQKYDETGNHSIDAWAYIERIGAVCSIIGGIGFAVNVYINLETANSQMPMTATTEIVQNTEGLQSTYDETTDLDKPSEPLSETERESFSAEESLQTTLEESSSESPVFPTTAAAFPVSPETSMPIVPPGPSVSSLSESYDSQLVPSADNEDVSLVFVDDVTGIEVTEAKDILERAGLTCNIIYPSGKDNWNGWAYVVNQEPCADYVPFGSSVTLNVEIEEEQWWEEEPETRDNLIEVANVISFTQDEAVSLLTDLGRTHTLCGGTIDCCR